MKKAIHLAAFNRNIGDNGLNIAIEKMLSKFLSIDRMEIVGNAFEKDKINLLNKYDFVIFGGGGLIHSCSGGISRKNRTRTGTMWNIELKDLRKLKPRIITYGVGYNRFTGEPDPLPAMGKFFDVLKDRKSIISFRNDNSKNKFLEYFPRFKDSVLEIPDPGLFCRHSIEKKENYVVIQIATDRINFRYPNGIKNFISELNSLLKLIPYKTILIPHTVADEKIYKKFKRELGVSIIYPLMNKMNQTMKIIEVYKKAIFTISTRGHSQLFSIGNNIPTFSISTHNKVKDFMIKHDLGEYNYDYLKESRDVGMSKFKHFLLSQEKYYSELIALNEDFDKQIMAFNNIIKNSC